MHLPVRSLWKALVFVSPLNTKFPFVLPTLILLLLLYLHHLHHFHRLLHLRLLHVFLTFITFVFSILLILFICIDIALIVQITTTMATKNIIVTGASRGTQVKSLGIILLLRLLSKTRNQATNALASMHRHRPCNFDIPALACLFLRRSPRRPHGRSSQRVPV